MKTSRRGIWIGLGILAVLAMIMLAIAPLNGPITKGSTFSRAPDGYGAWYAYMEAQGIEIQRWQRPPDALRELASDTPTTLLQVVPADVPFVDYEWNDWVRQGNTLIVLQSRDRVTPAPFSSELTSATLGNQQPVTIETRRRRDLTLGNAVRDEDRLLQDSYGAVVWRRALGEGAFIEATTPYIAANAYQDAPGNFAFLADLMTIANEDPNATLFVDEYLHGYEELIPEDEVTESNATWVSYLSQTPLLVVTVQAIALILALFWGNQRIGPPVVIPQPQQNNSEAYISALSGVLRQARSTRFVVEMVTKAEQLRLQKNLGLGSVLVDEDILVNTWSEQTKRSPTALTSMLELGKQQSSLQEKDLATWLETIRTLHQD